MHHPGLLLILLLLALLLGPLVAQGLSALVATAGPLLAMLPGAALIANLTAPALVVAVLLLGVAVVGVVRLFVGV